MYLILYLSRYIFYVIVSRLNIICITINITYNVIHHIIYYFICFFCFLNQCDNVYFSLRQTLHKRLTHLCWPVRSTSAVRETASLGIMGAPRVPPLNPSESIVLSESFGVVLPVETWLYYQVALPHVCSISDKFILKFPAKDRLLRWVSSFGIMQTNIDSILFFF